MKKALALVCLSLFLMGFVSISLADEVSLEASARANGLSSMQGGKNSGRLQRWMKGPTAYCQKGGSIWE